MTSSTRRASGRAVFPSQMGTAMLVPPPIDQAGEIRRLWMEFRKFQVTLHRRIPSKDVSKDLTASSDMFLYFPAALKWRESPCKRKVLRYKAYDRLWGLLLIKSASLERSAVVVLIYSTLQIAWDFEQAPSALWSFQSPSSRHFPEIIDSRLDGIQKGSYWPAVITSLCSSATVEWLYRVYANHDIFLPSRCAL